jgi:hypothetical protein
MTYPLPPIRVADPERLLDLQAEEDAIDELLLDEAEKENPASASRDSDGGEQ